MKPLKSICESSFGAGCSKRCHGCAASLAASLIRPFLLRTCPIVLAAGGPSPRFCSTRRILRAFQTGCPSRTSRILRSIAASVLFGECSGRRERSSYVSLSSAPRSIHLYAVLGDTPYRRHNSRTFAPGPLARLTNSRRRDTIDTSLHPIAASCHKDCSGAVNVSTMSPPPVHHVPGTYRPAGGLPVGFPSWADGGGFQSALRNTIARMKRALLSILLLTFAAPLLAAESDCSSLT